MHVKSVPSIRNIPIPNWESRQLNAKKAGNWTYFFEKNRKRPINLSNLYKKSNLNITNPNARKLSRSCDYNFGSRFNNKNEKHQKELDNLQVVPSLTFTTEKQVKNRPTTSIDEIDDQNYVIHKLNPIMPKASPLTVSHIRFNQSCNTNKKEQSKQLSIKFANSKENSVETISKK